MNTLKIGVVLGSTRTGRKGAVVADWVLEHAAAREADYVLIDLAEHPLPHLEEPVPPMAGRYSDPRTLDWAAVIGELDRFVVITPEYNHGMPGVLKNAFDHLHAEWGDKAIGFVGYGVAGGARSLDQLRVLSGVLGMADVMPQVELSLFEDFADDGVLPVGRHVQALRQLFDKVEAWSSALKPFRS